MGKTLLSTLLLITIILFSLSTKAQTNNAVRFGIGINGGTSVEDPTRATLGIDARLQAPFGNNVSGILTTGYYHFFKKDDFESFGIVPVKAGLKYFPVKNVYVAGEAGAGIATKGSDNVSFMYSPSVGLAFANGLDVSVKFEDYTRFDFPLVAFRIAYGFKL